MSIPTNFLAAGDFKLRHWRSPAFRRVKEKDPAATPTPLSVDITQEANGDREFRNWSSDSNNNSRQRQGYTSIRDLIASSPRSCMASPRGCGSEIQIRNPLVKQAVCAYLQLTPSCVESTAGGGWILNFRRFVAAISAALRPFRRCFEIFARLLCCASSGEYC